MIPDSCRCDCKPRTNLTSLCRCIVQNSMIFDGMALIVAGLVISLVRGEQPTPCPSDTVTVELTSTSGVKPLTDAMNCRGAGTFNVTLYGRIQIDQIIEISHQKYVTLAAPVEKALDSSSDDYLYAEMDAAHQTGIFSVTNGSTLSISNLIIARGRSMDGGAVVLTSSSFLHVFDCNFTNNTASSAGGEQTLRQQHTIIRHFHCFISGSAFLHHKASHPLNLQADMLYSIDIMPSLLTTALYHDILSVTPPCRQVAHSRSSFSPYAICPSRTEDEAMHLLAVVFRLSGKFTRVHI